MDVVCRNCGEPWDVAELEDWSEGEKKQFFSGKGCPSCKGEPTYRCVKCGEVYKSWMKVDMLPEEIELVWVYKECLKCFGGLERVMFDEDFYGSVVECDGAIEDVTGKSVIDYMG